MVAVAKACSSCPHSAEKRALKFPRELKRPVMMMMMMMARVQNIGTLCKAQHVYMHIIRDPLPVGCLVHLLVP